MNKLRATDKAYDVLENMIATLALAPGLAINEHELQQKIGLGRTPIREALMRLSAQGLIHSAPHRGFQVSSIDIVECFDAIETCRILKILIAQDVVLHANGAQQAALVTYSDALTKAAQQQDVVGFIQADQTLMRAIYSICYNRAAVTAVTPLVTKCRRLLYAFQHEGRLLEHANCLAQFVQGVVKHDPKLAAAGFNAFMDLLKKLTHPVLTASLTT